MLIYDPQLSAWDLPLEADPNDDIDIELVALRMSVRIVLAFMS